MAKLSDYVVRFVADQGVRHVFVVTGGGAMHLNESLGRCRDLVAICNSHEQASAIAAEGYAKATNKLGVAMVTTGPGGTNAVTGVAGAWLDSTPMLFLSGQVKRPDRMFDSSGHKLGMRQLGVQEVDIVSIVSPITKYAVTVLDPLQIRYELEKAVHIARTGRPGPVWVDIPLDVQAAPLPDPKSLREFEADAPSSAREPSRLSGEVRAVIAALNKSERPLILAGNGIRLAKGEQEFTQLRHRLQLPLGATWCAADLVPSEYALNIGRPGSVAARGANFALQNCDFLLVIGARMDFAITGYAPDRLAREAHKVMVDIDPAELKKLEPHIQHPICADAKAFLSELLAQADGIEAKPRVEWKQRCADWKTRYPVVTDEHRKPDGLVSIYHFAEEIGEAVDRDDAMISGNSGSAIEIFLLACPARSGQRIYHTAGLGAMGYAVPISIGVSLATGAKRVVCIDGDGGFQFNIQELETVARLGLPIKFFVLNNNGYASIRASQKNYFGEATLGCDRETGLTIPDISRVAAAYGLQTAVIDTQRGLRDRVREILAMPGPVVCDVRVIPDELREPRLSSFQKPDGTFVSKPLEDLFPFLDRREFFANMIVKPLPE